MKNVIISIKMILLMIVLTGIVYPLLITLIGQIFFYEKVNGSMITVNSKIIGSKLIGQNFSSDRYFHGRPSASNYSALPSIASNLALSNKKLLDDFNERRYLYKDKNDIPSDLLFSSASGIDPDISPKSALLQVDRIASARNFNQKNKEQLIKYINDHIQERDLFILGDKRINVLKLNIALDEMDNN